MLWKDRPSKEMISLGILTGFAILIRALPMYLHAAWGVDFGIYLGLTNSFVETNQLIAAYDGWGSSYNYFPILYTMAAGIHTISGLSIVQSLSVVAPIIGGLTVTVFYFTTKELTKDKKIALIAAGLLATTTFHIYQTSHAAPLVMGHFFMMLSFYFLIRFIKGKSAMIPLLGTSALLILSHHFTTYFYIISATAIILTTIANKKTEKKAAHQYILYAVLVSGMAFGYWRYVAIPVYDHFMNGHLFLSSIQVVLVYYLGLFIGYIMCRKVRRIRDSITKSKPEKEPQIEKRVAIYFCIMLVIALGLMIFGIPGTHIPFNAITVIISIPLFIVLSFGIIGFSMLKRKAQGLIVFPWLLAVIGSLVYSVTFQELFPDRHLEYLIVPLCIAAAIAMHHYVVDTSSDKLKKIKKISIKQYSFHLTTQQLRWMAIIVVLLSNAIVAYPTIDSLDMVDESISNSDIAAMEWMQENLDNETSIITSDHRLAVLSWAYGFNMSFEEVNHTWEANTTEEMMHELDALKTTHVIIDDVMVDTVVNVKVGDYDFMTNKSYDKFKENPFTLLYRNATYGHDGQIEHWAEIYAYL